MPRTGSTYLEHKGWGILPFEFHLRLRRKGPIGSELATTSSLAHCRLIVPSFVEIEGVLADAGLRSVAEPESCQWPRKILVARGCQSGAEFYDNWS